MITGGLLVNYVNNSRPSKLHKPQQEAHGTATNQVTRADAVRLKPPEILNKQFLQRLDDNLHLTFEQHDTIQKIITNGQNQMRKVIQDSRLEIRDVLSSQQLKQFDDLMKRPFRKVLFNTNSAPAIPSFTNAPATNTSAI